MFDHMVKANNLLYEFAKYQFDDDDLMFIKEQISGPRECAGSKVIFNICLDLTIITIKQLNTAGILLCKLLSVV